MVQENGETTNLSILNSSLVSDQPDQLLYAKQYLNCVKNCTSIGSRIGLEKRIFDFKTFAPSLMVEEDEGAEEDIDIDQSRDESDSSQKTGIDNADFAKYSDGLLHPFNSQSSILEEVPFRIQDFLTLDEEDDYYTEK